MSKELIISGKPIKIIEWKGQRVITTREMSEVHELDTRILNQKFRRNKHHFTLDVDYFIVSQQDAMNVTNCDFQNMFTKNDILILFTESGYLRFVKTINDDKAWHIYGQLIDAYFLNKKLNNIGKQFLEKSKEHRKGLTSEWKEHEAKDYRMLTLAEYESLFGDDTKRKKNMDDKELTLLSAFEFLECKKLENNPQIKGDIKLKVSLKDTGHKINDIVKPKLVS